MVTPGCVWSVEIEVECRMGGGGWALDYGYFFGVIVFGAVWV